MVFRYSWKKLVGEVNICGGGHLAAIVFCCDPRKKRCPFRDYALKRLEISVDKFIEVKDKHKVEGKLCFGNLSYCVTGDTKVLLKDGELREIKEIVENEEKVEVLSFDDKLRVVPRKVTHFWKIPSPRTLIYIKTRSGRELVITSDNEVPILRGGRVIWVSAGNLKEGDYILAPLRYQGEELELDPSELLEKGRLYRNVTNPRLFLYETKKPGYAVPIRLPRTLTSDILYVHGLISADGSNSGKTVYFTNVEEILHNMFQSTLKNHFKINVHTYKSNNSRTLISTANNKALAELFSELSHKLLLLPKELIRAWMAGVIDGDGYVTNNRLEIAAGSLDFAYTVLVASLRLGLYAYLRKANRRESIINGRIITPRMDGYWYVHFAKTDELFRELREIAKYVVLERKKKSLEQLTTKKLRYSFMDVIPLNDYLRKNKMLLSATEYANYVCNSERPSRMYLRRSKLMSLDIVRKLVNSDVFFDKVVEVRQVESKEPYVYDLTVEGTENFVANFLFIHNCCSPEKNCPVRDRALAKLGWSYTRYLQYKWEIFKDLVPKDKWELAFSERVLKQYAMELLELDNQKIYKALGYGNIGMKAMWISEVVDDNTMLKNDIGKELGETEFVGVRVPRTILRKIDDLVDRGVFKSRSQAIRSGLTLLLKAYVKQEQ